MAGGSPGSYGRTEAEWERLTDEALRFLIERARMARLTSYTELNTVLHTRTGLRPFDFNLDGERAAKFVASAFGSPAYGYSTAWQGAHAWGMHGGAAPRGALVFFAPHSSNGNAGHVGISLGDGRMVSAEYNGVPRELLRHRLLGLALPRVELGTT